MNEQNYHRMNADIEAGGYILAALEAILKDWDCENVAQLKRDLYKRTACGAWLAVKRHDDIIAVCDAVGKVGNGDVRALIVGSIVEGSDAEVMADPIDLLKYEDPDDAVKAFNDAVQWVDDEASALFGEANEGVEQ